MGPESFLITHNNPLENNLLPDCRNFDYITISFDSGGSGGGAYFMGFVQALSKEPKLISYLDMVTGVSAGGYAAYFLATGQPAEGYLFWKKVCSPYQVILNGGIQSNINKLTEKLLRDAGRPLLLPLTIYTKLMPSTDPARNTATLKDRLSSRFGFKILEFIYWSIGINNHDIEFAFSLKSGEIKPEAKRLLQKVLVGGARFLPIIMGPTIKITKNEAASQNEASGIVHDYGLITLLGGVESVTKTFPSNKHTLHFVVISQSSNEKFWNGLHTRKIRKLSKSHPNATVILIPAITSLPRSWHRLPNWITIKKSILKSSHDIGYHTGQNFTDYLKKVISANSNIDAN